MISRFPSREQRQACWTARDAYWDCLDKHGLWLHGLRPREKPKEGGVPIENPELQQSGPQNVRPNPFGPAAADPVASAPDGTPTGKTPSGQNMVTINRNLSKEEVAELSVCEQFKDAFERECVPSWVEHFNAKRISEKKQELRAKLAERESERLQREMEAKRNAGK